jgi:hypothetical protein
VAGARWIDLLDPSRVELEKALPQGLHDRALSRLLAPATHEDEPRPTLESHEGYVFGIFMVAVAVPDAAAGRNAVQSRVDSRRPRGRANGDGDARLCARGRGGRALSLAG